MVVDYHSLCLFICVLGALILRDINGQCLCFQYFVFNGVELFISRVFLDIVDFLGLEVFVFLFAPFVLLNL